MTDFSEPILFERRWKTRVKRVIINNLLDDKQLIIDVESIPYDNNVPNYNQIISLSPIKVNISKVASETVTTFDPILGQNVTISVEGLISALDQVLNSWA